MPCPTVPTVGREGGRKMCVARILSTRKDSVFKSSEAKVIKWREIRNSESPHLAAWKQTNKKSVTVRHDIEIQMGPAGTVYKQLFISLATPNGDAPAPGPTGLAYTRRFRLM